MSKHLALWTTVACLSAAPAFSDITAQEIWDEWQAIQASYGTTMTAASQTMSGGVLTLSNVTTTNAQGNGSFTGRLAQIVMTEQSDGSILVELAPTYEVTASSTNSGKTTVSQFNLTHQGLTIRASGDDQRQYDTTADAITFELVGIVEGGRALPVTGSMVANNLVSNYRLDTTASPQTFTSTSTIGGVILDVAAQGTSTADSFDFDYTISDITSSGSGSFPTGKPLANAASLSELGLDLTGQMTYQSNTFAMAFSSQSDGSGNLSVTSGAGGLDVAITPDQIAYGGTANDIAVSAQVPDFPFPIEISIAASEGRFAMPMGKTTGPEDFSLKLAYTDFAVNDVIWGLFDPTGQLPRDPATIILDLTGKATLFVDIFSDPEVMAELKGPPGELNGLTLEQLKITFAGADLDGTGDVTFLNNGPTPQPVGKINLSLDGGLALLDKLVAMGFVPPQEAAGIKAMSGMVARPVGPDQLESEIEFTPSGGIIANGLPLQ